MTPSERSQFDRLTNRVNQLETQNRVKDAELAALREMDLSASTRAAEQLAACGIIPRQKGTAGELQDGGSGVGLWARYMAASPEEKARMLDEMPEKLERAAAAADRAQEGPR